ncbi:MAG TPA: ATP-binding cassette domain-containing protein, partial [Candidatus Polarisedimenticolia bacterium]|nr:ATP-binding cassette domain-containing protein [Candidatus Polarisedimenticolia bacterium]
MKDLRKVVPPGREILKGISLSFFFGAKIGVIGANGAGKSSLLRIMAGEDSRFLGEALPARGIRTGFLSQEPRLDPKKTVLGNVEEGVREARALLDRYNAISERLGEPLDTGEMETLLEEQAQVQDRIDATNAWELDRTLEIAMDALRCPPPDADVAAISGGEAQRIKLSKELSRRATGRTVYILDEPTNHLDAESVGMAPRARQAKSKARLAAYERLLAEETERLPETVEIYIPPGPRLGGVV